MQKKEAPIIAIINAITECLPHDFEPREQHAWWILQAITGKKKESLITHQNLILTDQQQKTLNHWLDQLINHNEPLQYLIGSVPFADLEILVEAPILIPRPETENWCINLIQQLQHLTDQKLTILDLCSGSGCIALAVAKAVPKATIYGIDISHKAIALANKNKIHNHISNATFLHSDLYGSLSSSFTFDLIVANPPYISQDAWQQLSASVTQWEDKNALVASNGGVAIIKKIIQCAPDYLHSHEEMKQRNIPQLILEIGYDQAQIVQNLMREHNFNNIMVEKDLAGKDRIVSGRIDNVATHADQQRTHNHTDIS